MTQVPLNCPAWVLSATHRRTVPLRFDLCELSGSLGDLGVFLPLSLAMAMTCGMHIGLIFIFAGLMNIVTGIWFRQPIPVQPMKVPSSGEWWTGLIRGTVPQLPLTLLNSVIAVCALSSDYFPGRGIAPRRIAVSVGVMNLLCMPLGEMPMCHGAGGLAGRFRFGARTGGSIIMLGVIMVIAGGLFGGLLLPALHDRPTSVFSVMVIGAGLSLALAARDSLSGWSFVTVAAMIVVTLVLGTLSGFLVGCALALAVAAFAKLRRLPG